MDPANNRRTVWCTYTIVSLGALTAIYLILSRFLAVNIGGFGRIQLGVVARIMAGVWFGPFAGALCGLASDLLGCLIQGYAVNPLITLAAILWGVIPALFVPQNDDTKKTAVWKLCLGPPASSVPSLSQPPVLSGSMDIICTPSSRRGLRSLRCRHRSTAYWSACCTSALLPVR